MSHEELPEDDERMVAAKVALANLLTRYLGDKSITRDTQRDLNELLYIFAVDFKRRFGYTFPRMTGIILPRFGMIHLHRRDLDLEEVQKVIVNLTVEHPTITAEEIAHAIASAWPDYAHRIDASQRLVNAPVPETVQ
jgi:hypothetical protein